MFKKFLSGIVFGAGFSIAFLVCAYIGLIQITLPNAKSTPYSTFPISSSEFSISSFEPPKETPTRDLTIDEKIEHATAIVITEFQLQNDGKKAAIITEIVKKNEDVDLFYSIGDEYSPDSYYPSEDQDRGDGIVIFFRGNPAKMRYSYNYRGDRITGLSDIPISLFRQKCQKITEQN